MVPLGKKTLLDDLSGGWAPPIMKKYRILWCNTLKFRSFVVVTAFFGNIGTKPYLTTYQGEAPPPNKEKIQNTVVQHPEISIFCSCNRFFLKLEGSVRSAKIKTRTLSKMVKIKGGGPFYPPFPITCRFWLLLQLGINQCCTFFQNAPHQLQKKAITITKDRNFRVLHHSIL